jgi:hypothetical protein
LVKNQTNAGESALEERRDLCLEHGVISAGVAAGLGPRDEILASTRRLRSRVRLALAEEKG